LAHACFQRCQVVARDGIVRQSLVGDAQVEQCLLDLPAPMVRNAAVGVGEREVEFDGQREHRDRRFELVAFEQGRAEQVVQFAVVGGDCRGLLQVGDGRGPVALPVGLQAERLPQAQLVFVGQVAVVACPGEQVVGHDVWLAGQSVQDELDRRIAVERARAQQGRKVGCGAGDVAG